MAFIVKERLFVKTYMERTDHTKYNCERVTDQRACVFHVEEGNQTMFELEETTEETKFI